MRDRYNLIEGDKIKWGEEVLTVIAGEYDYLIDEKVYLVKNDRTQSIGTASTDESFKVYKLKVETKSGFRIYKYPENEVGI
jgi:hypothetical protein